MLVQSGRPVGVMRTHEWAPRVLIANSNLVGDWATWPEFRRLEHLGLTMYGQMTAGSWIYIGTQGIVQGTYETFAAVAEKRFGGTLAGTLTLTGGCGGMGGAQPLAVTLNEGVCLIVDVDRVAAAAPGRAPLPRRGRRRPRRRGREGAARPRPSGGPGRSASSATAPRCSPSCCAAASTIDIVTDQTSAHDPLSYLPEGIDLADWHDYAESKPEEFTDRARASMAKHVEAMVGFQDARRRGLRLRQLDPRRGPAGRLRPGVRLPRASCPAYIRPLFCEGKGPFRWAALSGDPKDIARHRPGRDGPVPRQRPAAEVDARRPGADRVPGPAGPDLLARLRRAGQGRAARSTSWSPRGELSARRSSSAATTSTAARSPRPYRETESMARRLRRDRRLAAAQRAGQHRVRRVAGCRSTTAAASASAGRSTPARSRWPTAPTLAAQKLARVLTNDPGMGVIRHVDAGYDLADAGRRGARRPHPDARGTPVSRVSAA